MEGADSSQAEKTRGTGPRPLETESSAELLDRARAGDGGALDRLYERYLPLLRRWASGRLPGWARDLVDTDDMVQETVEQTLGQVSRFEPRREGALQTYLRLALQSRIRDALRRARRKPVLTSTATDGLDPSPSPLEEAVGKETIQRYEAALGRLGEADRQLILARVELGLGYQELAEAVGRPSSEAARVAVGRALVRLALEMSRERSL